MRGRLDRESHARFFAKNARRGRAHRENASERARARIWRAARSKVDSDLQDHFMRKKLRAKTLKQHADCCLTFLSVFSQCAEFGDEDSCDSIDHRVLGVVVDLVRRFPRSIRAGKLSACVTTVALRTENAQASCESDEPDPAHCEVISNAWQFARRAEGCALRAKKTTWTTTSACRAC